MLITNLGGAIKLTIFNCEYVFKSANRPKPTAVAHKLQILNGTGTKVERSTSNDKWGQ